MIQNTSVPYSTTTRLYKWQLSQTTVRQRTKPRLVYEGMSYIMDRTTDAKTYGRCVKFFLGPMSISSIFQCTHRTLWVFLKKLINEENSTHAHILQICAGQPPKKKKVNDRLKNRLLNLVANPHRDILLQID